LVTLINFFKFFSIFFQIFFSQIFFNISGLYDSIPVQETLNILKVNLPGILFTKLKKYVTNECDNVRSHIDWNFFHHKLEKLNLDVCANQLIKLLEKPTITEDQVKTFHISTNKTSNLHTEPTSKNTSKMIYQFLMSIYQRNIIASLVKYILLKDILQKLSTSQLTDTHKGVFSSIKNRLQEIIFECVLTAFNGSNYDNYLICNNLVIILTNLNEKIHLFKKGASISTVKIVVKKNLTRFQNIQHTIKQKVKQETSNKWIMNLYIKDIRNLVAANMSLDKIGKLFNLKVSKLCFPYEKATSIQTLKSITSLHPNDDLFWRDTFSSKEISLETRLEAQVIFNMQGFANLYEYSEYYLKQDCVLLHSIVLTLFDNYLADDINIFLRRNYSQSNLAYQQFFIVEPSRQIDQVLAPKKISNTFFNYFIKLAVTGGLCTSFVHGDINSTTVINEHFNYLENPRLDPETWPNFDNLKPWEKAFRNTPSGIITIDIRSLYPSATVKKMPVNSPLFFTRCIRLDSETIHRKTKTSTVDVQSFCENVRKKGSYKTDRFQLINDPPRFHNEFHALNHYLASLPENIKIIRFQSSFTALGQLYLARYPVDGFLVFKTENSQTTFIKVIQYHSVFRHGHITSCCIKNDENQQKLANDTLEVKTKISLLMHHLVVHFNLNHVEWEYVEISDCEFNHTIPKFKDKNFIFPYKKLYTYKGFLDNILTKKLTGLIVVKDLEIKKNNQNPCFGFIIQKAEYTSKHLSDYTRKQLTKLSPGPKVISLHKSSSFMVISTDYFVWLYNTFGFEQTPDIYHALLFQQAHYLRSQIELKLKTRKILKEKIKNERDPEKKQIYEIRAELIKLMLNSCYGFTLCNLTSSKFKSFINMQTIPKHTKRKQKIASCVQLSHRVYLAEYKTSQIQSPFETMLGHVGCSILFHSKIILLRRLNYLLKFLNPTKAQLLYMDTDSAHFLVKHKRFEDNVDENLKSQFLSLFDKHFETGDKISGIWVEEGFFNSGKYIGEKSYVLTDENKTLSHMKGLNSTFQKNFVTENIDPYEKPNISYHIMHKSPDFAIYKTYMNKNLFSNYVPIKRYFVYAAGSLPLKIN
jgi:hypothetical protein